MRYFCYLLAAAVIGQAVFGSGALLVNNWLSAETGLVERLTADTEARVRHALGEEAVIPELVAANVPDDAVVFVDWPVTFRADPNATDIGEEAEPIIHWITTIEQVRMLLYPEPTIIRMRLNAFDLAEAMSVAGADVWLAAPGRAMVARIAPLLPPPAAELPAAFGIPEGRPGWSLAAENPRCQLWRYQKD